MLQAPSRRYTIPFHVRSSDISREDERERLADFRSFKPWFLI